MPSSPLNLLVPSSVAGATPGYTANKAGSWISPPPPTIASMSPAANAAASTSNRSNDNSPTLEEYRYMLAILQQRRSTLGNPMRAPLQALLLGCLLLTAGPL